MKRDWKLIRAIILEESTANWPEGVVVNHQILCGEAGFANVVGNRGRTGEVRYYRPKDDFITQKGREVGKILANADDLDAVLKQLDAAGTGHATATVLDLMKQRDGKRGP